MGTLEIKNSVSIFNLVPIPALLQAATKKTLFIKRKRRNTKKKVLRKVVLLPRVIHRIKPTLHQIRKKHTPPPPNPHQKHKNISLLHPNQTAAAPRKEILNLPRMMR